MITPEEVVRAALEENSGAREAFMTHHGTHAKRIAQKLGTFYADFAEAIKGWPNSARCTTVGQFIHVAGNSLVQSLNLLVAGMGGPSGNLMRHYAEAVAMALLCTADEIGVLERYLADRKTYPIHKALDRLLQEKPAKALRAKVGFDAKAWAKFKASMTLFDHHSHSGVVVVGFHLRFGKKAGGIIVGTEYDPQKFGVYRRELRFRASATNHLRHLLGALDPLMRASA